MTPSSTACMANRMPDSTIRRSDAFHIRPVEPRDDAALAAVIRTVMPEFGAVGSGFAINNPNAVSSCACGSSFNTDGSPARAGGCH